MITKKDIEIIIAQGGCIEIPCVDSIPEVLGAVANRNGALYPYSIMRHCVVSCPVYKHLPTTRELRGVNVNILQYATLREMMDAFMLLYSKLRRYRWAHFSCSAHMQDLCSFSGKEKHCAMKYPIAASWFIDSEPVDLADVSYLTQWDSDANIHKLINTGTSVHIQPLRQHNIVRREDGSPVWSLTEEDLESEEYILPFEHSSELRHASKHHREEFAYITDTNYDPFKNYRKFQMDAVNDRDDSPWLYTKKKPYNLTIHCKEST